MILNEFELSSKESDLFLVPLQGAKDVLIEFEGRVLGVVFVGLSMMVSKVRVVEGGDDVDFGVESYFAVEGSSVVPE